MQKLALRPESPTFKMLSETSLFQMLKHEQQTEIIESMIDDQNYPMDFF